MFILMRRMNYALLWKLDQSQITIPKLWRDMVHGLERVQTEMWTIGLYATATIGRPRILTHGHDVSMRSEPHNSRSWEYEPMELREVKTKAVICRQLKFGCTLPAEKASGEA